MYLQTATSPLLPFATRHSSVRILPLKRSHGGNLRISAERRGGAIRSPIQNALQKFTKKIFNDMRFFYDIGPVREGGAQGKYEVVAI